MSQMTAPKKMGFIESHKYGLVALLLAAMPMAASAATLDLNATLGPLISSIVQLIPSIIDLIVAIVPAILILSVVGFLVAFLDKILSLLKL